jgi:hypothetical protein
LGINAHALSGGKANRRVLLTAVSILAPNEKLIVIEGGKYMAQIWAFNQGDLSLVEEASSSDLTIKCKVSGT